jgi:hypothetical protein
MVSLVTNTIGKMLLFKILKPFCKLNCFYLATLLPQQFRVFALCPPVQFFGFSSFPDSSVKCLLIFHTHPTLFMAAVTRLFVS